MNASSLPLLALTDVDDILNHYLTEAGVEIAGQFLDGLELSLRQIGQEPGIGSPRLALSLKEPALRVWPIRGFPYLIFYLNRPTGVEIWRVLHTSRDIPSQLRE
jgi:toxin ParE1/3/4